ncbi:MAG: DUF5004 domain-containing protein [Muriicola sp.]
MNIIVRNSIVGFTSLLFTVVCSQERTVQDIYGQWQFMGSFRDGQQVLEALKDTIANQNQYYFTFNQNGTFTYDIVSLENQKNATRNGSWHLSPNGKRLTLIDSAIDQENRKIPDDFLNFASDGSLSTKPLIFPILELTATKLVLYDEYHKTLDIFRK